MHLLWRNADNFRGIKWLAGPSTSSGINESSTEDDSALNSYKIGTIHFTFLG